VSQVTLDPAHYYILPGFTWDAMLKYTRIRFELFTDTDMVMFIERGIRSGLCQCSGRYAQANNKYSVLKFDMVVVDTSPTLIKTPRTFS